ncbi:urea carboxylase [Tenacibaculum sp. MAR_2009_124]|uniref:5-oxoprolinase subunit B family protein n=1 Tax=Tenacibaculum sp. MAR_2009_124 TaxID=1250059 RepID=UPI00089C8195|nr:allophanate hydrolase subunit 1 [Tenacibaculum sp. MAR_2009_124]SEC94025.1 urea carboxylase [Tenacibaculum sp. MAR_2009_124]
MKTRYTFGGDEHLFVECSEEMSLAPFFKVLSLTEAIRKESIKGVTEICPANASFQLRFNPDIIEPNLLLNIVKRIEQESENNIQKEIKTRIIEIPVLYNDPWTHETLMRFRDRHQKPEGTDLEYASEINNYQSVEAFIKAHSSSPWFVSMVGFVAGLPFMYQMVEREQQIQVPKYLRPRTDTPKLTLGHGGCFACIYSVKGAGGYQMFGVTPLPIYDPKQDVKYLEDFMVFFRPGDIIKFRPIERSEYDQIVKEIEVNTYKPNIKEVTFNLDEYNKDINSYNKNLVQKISE